jgi:hypothetical protein
MKRIASIIMMMSFMAVIFLGLTTLAFGELKTTVTLKAIPESYSGKCPATIKFEGEITATDIEKPPLKLKYRFKRKDGTIGPIETLIFDKDGTKKVSTTWTLGGPSLPYYEGTLALEIVSPIVSPTGTMDWAYFKIKCEKPIIKIPPAVFKAKLFCETCGPAKEFKNSICIYNKGITMIPKGTKIKWDINKASESGVHILAADLKPNDYVFLQSALKIALPSGPKCNAEAESLMDTLK